MATDLEDLQTFLASRKGAQLQSTTPATPTPVDSNTNNPATLTKFTQQALTAVPGALQNAMPRAIEAQGDLSWFDLNQRTDEQGRVIPIDTSQGLDLGDFARVVFQRRPEDQITVLRQMFPNSLVRRATTGEPLIEINDAIGGGKHDVLLSPPASWGRNLIQAAETSAGATAGGVAGMAVGNMLGSRLGPMAATAGRVIGGAVGSGIGGALQDVTARAAEGIPLDMGEIAREQTKQAALNAMWDVGMFAGSKVLRAASPFATEHGPLQLNLQEAKDYLKREHGINFETTPAEESGSPLLGRLERTESQLPGASTVLGGIYKRGQASLTDMLQAAVGGAPTTEELGRDLMATARRSLVEPAEAAVQGAQDALVRKGETELADTIAGIAPTAVTKKEAGDAIRESFKAAHASAKAEKDAAYAAVKALPGGTSKILPGDPVANAAAEILDELPKVLKTEVVPAVDAYGNPVSKAVVKQKVLSSGRPEGLATFLADMQAQRGQKMSIDELTTLKNAARDEIAKTEAVPGVKDRWFGIISDAYDKAIMGGVDALPNGNLKNALENARNVYKTKFLPFDQEGLHDVLRTPLETGFQSPEQLVNRLFSGGRAEHNYRALQGVLGKNSIAFQKVRSSVLNGWMEKSADELTGRINPIKFESFMAELRDQHKEIFNDVIQGNAQAFFKATRTLKAAGKEITDVDPAELRVLLSRGNPTAADVQRLMDAQRARDSVLANTYLSDLATGKKTATSPAQFVASLFNSQIDSQHLQEVLSTLAPAQIESLQKAALYRVLTKASESSTDMAKFLAGEQSPVQAFALAKAIGPVGSAERSRNEMLMGPDFVNMTRAVIGALAPREIKTGLFKAAGSMAATGMLEKLLSMPLQYASKYVQKSIAAEIYTSAPVKAALANQVLGPREVALVANTLIASEPFIRHMVEVYGNDAAYSIVRDAKSSIDRFLKQDVQVDQSAAQKAELVRFLQGQKAKVKTNAIP